MAAKVVFIVKQWILNG